jgi:hypothetical protein
LRDICDGKTSCNPFPGKAYKTNQMLKMFNSLTPELNPSAQRCLTKFFTGDFAN